MRDQLEMCAPCLFGLEAPVAAELRDMGAQDVRAQNGRVLFSGDEGILARANLRSACAERIAIRVGEFPAASFEELFEGAKTLPWEEYLGREDAFPVTGSCLSSRLRSVPDCQAILKKAVVSRLQERYSLSWFPESGPLHRVRFLILKDRASLLIDTSGEGLHKRGYRRDSNEAPLKETLAAALVRLSRLREDGRFYDPFCGSGTLLIEAALFAVGIAPGIQRSFAAEEWAESDPAVWQRERELARSLEHRNTGFQAWGGDIDPVCAALTRANAAKAGVGELIAVEQRDAAEFRPQGERGCLVCNPPYGQRLADLEQARSLCKTMGRVFEQKPGWSYGILSPEDDFEKLFGRRASKRRKLYNGSIACQFYQYFSGR